MNLWFLLRYTLLHSAAWLGTSDNWLQIKRSQTWCFFKYIPYLSSINLPKKTLKTHSTEHKPSPAKQVQQKGRFQFHSCWSTFNLLMITIGAFPRLIASFPLSVEKFFMWNIWFMMLVSELFHLCQILVFNQCNIWDDMCRWTTHLHNPNPIYKHIYLQYTHTYCVTSKSTLRPNFPSPNHMKSYLPTDAPQRADGSMTHLHVLLAVSLAFQALKARENLKTVQFWSNKIKCHIIHSICRYK